MKLRLIPTITAAGVVVALSALTVFAAVPAEEAAKLKSTLTPTGAEKAGNSDGSIPAWTGGYTQVPAGFKPGDARPDPFPDEKPLYSISAKNMDQYADKLTDGVKAMLKKYPAYRLDVYPTHRTAAAPQSVYDNTFKNATRAKIIDNGYGVEGAFGGYPFPIPKSGYEVMWNHRLGWQGETVTYPLSTWVVTPDGNRVLATRADETIQFPYYKKDGSLETFKGPYQLGKLITLAPPSKAGEAILVHEPISTSQPRAIWQYLVGQRRVRRAPSVAYDTPDFVTSGIGFFDEAFNLFGPFDHHEFKLIGKKEALVPYNNNRAASAKVADLVGPQYLNPDLVRWEKHRVWEVEATLAPGRRHVVPKRHYYIDEDSWQILLIDGWDAQGQLWRTNYTLTLLAPDIPALIGTVLWGVYNLQTGAYYLNSASNELPVQYKVLPGLPDGFYSPDDLANQGSR
jgi:hypothetical protein